MVATDSAEPRDLNHLQLGPPMQLFKTHGLIEVSRSRVSLTPLGRQMLPMIFEHRYRLHKEAVDALLNEELFPATESQPLLSGGQLLARLHNFPFCSLQITSHKQPPTTNWNNPPFSDSYVPISTDFILPVRVQQGSEAERRIKAFVDAALKLKLLYGKPNDCQLTPYGRHLAKKVQPNEPLNSVAS